MYKISEERMLEIIQEEIENRLQERNGYDKLIRELEEVIETLENQAGTIRSAAQVVSIAMDDEGVASKATAIYNSCLTSLQELKDNLQ